MKKGGLFLPKFKLIISGIGGGKTTAVFKEIEKLTADENEKITLIVPEQSLFSYQKQGIVTLGEQKLSKVEIVSFTSLVNQISEEADIERKDHLSVSSSAVLMSMALKDVEKELIVYRKSVSKKSGIVEFLALANEFKQNCVTVENILRVTENMENCILKNKLFDLAKVFSAYNSRVEESYFNPEDLISQVVRESAALEGYFKDRTVFIDSFYGFTATQYSFIEHILTNAKKTFVTLCTTEFNPNEKIKITDLFYRTKQTARRLYGICAEKGISIETPLNLGDNEKEFERYASDDLTHLEKVIFRDEGNSYEGEVRGIQIFKGESIYEECEFVAATIKRLVLEKGYRYRDFAVISRDLQNYSSPLFSALKKYEIDVFEDLRRDVDVSPVINFLSAALLAVSRNFETESVMRYLKTALTDVKPIEIAQAENYAYMWRIQGKQWLEDWVLSPGGFGTVSKTDLDELEKLNEIRSKIVAPLIELKNILHGGVDGEQGVKALWDLMVNSNANGNLKKLAEKLNEAGNTAQTIELERMWNLLMEMLDEMHTLLKDETRVTATKLSDVFELMLLVRTSGNIPQGLDQVTITDAQRMRISAPKIAFVVGVNDGVFPAAPKTVSSLTEKDRAQLEKSEIVLNDYGETLLASEHLISYCALCSPREKLFITYSEQGIQGDALSPGEIVLTVKNLFGDDIEITGQDLSEDYFIQSKQPAFEQYAVNHNREEENIKNLNAVLEEYLKNDEEYSSKNEALERMKRGRAEKISDSKIATDLFKEKMELSATQINRYSECAFKYFCDKGLKLKDLKRAEFDPLSIGSVTHYVLENLLKGDGEENRVEYLKSVIKETDKDNVEIRELVEKYLYEYVEQIIPRQMQTGEFIHMVEKLTEELFGVALRMIREFSDSDYIPVSFELSVGNEKDINNSISAYKVEGTDKEIEIKGFVDRVDIAEKDGKVFVRIVDYKQTGKKISFTRYKRGLDMQMFLYLFAIWKNGEKLFGKNLTPAGVAYYVSGTQVLGQGEKRESKEKTSAAVLKGDDLPRNFEGKELKESAFKKLEEKAKEIIGDMVNSLHKGLIPVNPVEGACKYCSYASVCRLDKDIEPETIDTGQTAEKQVYEQLNDEGGEQE